MTELREPTSDVQREAVAGAGNEEGRTEYEQELLNLVKTLHQNVDAIDPMVQEQKDRKRLSNLSGSLCEVQHGFDMGSRCIHCTQWNARLVRGSS